MNPLVSLAKQAVENYIKEGKIISVPEEFSRSELAELFKIKAGAFVTIERFDRLTARKNGDLRGCIGTYLPTKINIVEEIIHNAIAAATEDYRFGSIQKEELPYLSYTVYILSYPEPIKDIKELDPKKFGVIVKTGPFAFPNEKEIVFKGEIPYKTGLLLPDLDEVDTIEQQVAIACQKGGIDPQKEKIFIYRFTVEKHQ